MSNYYVSGRVLVRFRTTKMNKKWLSSQDSQFSWVEMWRVADT